ncbi:transmembrane protein 179-like isoform X2 [Oscarella lobularis]|uniref:transmembrane protein 179-like isoform X2 n=1 Tax=Oscarella lobularis TaxID=121494 RepID=UPI003313BA3F
MGVCLIHVEFVVLAMSVLASLIYMIATWVAKKDTFDGACFLFAEWDAESQSASNPIAASCNVVIFSAFPSIAIAVVATVANVVTLVRIRKGRRTILLWLTKSKIAVSAITLICLFGIACMDSAGMKAFCSSAREIVKERSGQSASCEDIMKVSLPKAWLQMTLAEYCLWAAVVVWLILLAMTIIEYRQKKREIEQSISYQTMDNKASGEAISV